MTKLSLERCLSSVISSLKSVQLWTRICFKEPKLRVGVELNFVGYLIKNNLNFLAETDYSWKFLEEKCPEWNKPCVEIISGISICYWSVFTESILLLWGRFLYRCISCYPLGCPGLGQCSGLHPEKGNRDRALWIDINILSSIYIFS